MELASHLVWEGILLLIVVVLAIVVVAGPLSLSEPSVLWYPMAALGLLTAGFALSLRTATPNLAIGGLSGAAGLAYAKLVDNDWPAPVAAGCAVLIVVVVGAVMGLLVGLTSAPAWAVSLGMLAVSQAVLFGVFEAVSVPIRDADGAIGKTGITVAAAIFVVVSIGGGVGWMALGPAGQALLSANREAVDPASWRPARLLGAMVGLTGSALLAGVAGVVAAAYIHVATTIDNGRLLPAIGAALLGGVSVFGRRGGIAGTVLAVMVVSLAGMAVIDLHRWVQLSLPAGAILVGLIVSWALERIAGPVTAPSVSTGQPAG